MISWQAFAVLAVNLSSARKGPLILTATEECRLRLVASAQNALRSTFWKQRYCKSSPNQAPGDRGA